MPYPNRSYLILAVVLPIFAIAPLFYPGYIQTHAGFVPLWNIADLRANIDYLGWKPPYIVEASFIQHDGILPYYLAALLPFSSVTTVKVVIGIGWLLGSIGMFLWLKSWLGSAGALVSALVYTYLPYQIAAVYVRGAWHESLFWGLLPWVILTTTYLVTHPNWKLVPIAAGGWLVIGSTQLGLTMWAMILVILLLLVVHPHQAFLPCLSIIAGMATLLLFRPIELAITPDFTEHLLYPFQLFSAKWGYGASRPGWEDGLSFQLGMVAIGLTIVAVALWQNHAQSKDCAVKRGADRRLIFFLSGALVFAILPLNFMEFLWHMPIFGDLMMDTLAYPWQLLGFSGLCLSVLAGTGTVWQDEPLSQLPILAAIIILVILSSHSYLEPQFIKANEIPSAPTGVWENNQLLLLTPQFEVVTSGNTAGLYHQQDISIPLAIYGTLQPNDILLVKLNWQPLKIFTKDWKLFIHLVDSNDNVIAQFDGYPQFDAKPEQPYRTSKWIPGEIITDAYPLRMPADLPTDSYRVFIGLYDETTFARLPVATDSNGKVILNVE